MKKTLSRIVALLLFVCLLCGGCTMSGASSVPAADSDAPASSAGSLTVSSLPESDAASSAASVPPKLTREEQEIYNYSPVCPQAWIDETGAVRFSETIKRINAEAQSLDGQTGAVSVFSDAEMECYILWADGSMSALYSKTDRLSEELKEIYKQQKQFYESLQAKAI